jgi:hypothetical protein
MDRAASGSGSGGEGQPRMYMYSGHDSTIMPLLQALGHDVVTWCVGVGGGSEGRS